MPLGMTTSQSLLAHGYQVGLPTIHIPQTLTTYLAGFGLGALNDADEDDIDIYDSGPSSRRNITAYEAGDENRYRQSIGKKGGPSSQVNASRVTPPRLLSDCGCYLPVLSPGTLPSNYSEMENQFLQSLYSRTLQ